MKGEVRGFVGDIGGRVKELEYEEERWEVEIRGEGGEYGVKGGEVIGVRGKRG